MLLQVKGKFRIRISFKVSKKINFPNFAKEELIDIANSNEILKFIPGFLVNAIEQGKTVVLDCINEANSTVRESLNGLLDKKKMERKIILICLKIQKTKKLIYIPISE